jgi:hypothetical protein
MGKLDSLRIDESPLAFASFAAKHNALVDLLAGMVGQNGISVVMAEKNAIIRANIAAGPPGNVAANTANLVGSTGYLANAYVANANIGTYPTISRVVNTGRTIRADADGLSVEGSSLDFNHDPVAGTGGWYVGTLRAEITSTALTANVTLREIDVCSGNVAMKMLVFGSAPY